MSSDDRFYMLEFRNRPVLKGDVGSMLRIEGLIVGGGGAHAELFLPGQKANHVAESGGCHIELSVEEWSDWLQRSDNPEILVGLPKVFQRKVRYEISGAVQQKVWAADGFRCLYCGTMMGKALLTIDHFMPLELGGKNDATNYLTACKPCNKNKGSEDPETWCSRNRVSIGVIRDHLKTRVL